MCGWNNLKELVDQLEAKKEYERAACICVFNKNMEKAKKDNSFPYRKYFC